MTFILKTKVPESFPRTEKIEIATADSAFDVFLSVMDGNLILQDSQTVMAVFDPLKSFWAFGFWATPFSARRRGWRKGDWQPLATLVRIPSLKEVRCPNSPDKQCGWPGRTYS